MSERMPRPGLIATVALVTILAASALSGCTGGDADQATTAFVTPAPPGGSESVESGGAAASDAARAESGATAADVAFMSAMIEHHLQAVELAELAPGRVSDPELAEFADRIAVVQSAEADAMRAWLDKRRSRDRANAEHDHGVMAGEISRSTFDRAATLEGPAFDELFIAAMVPHHRGALEMAEERLAEHGDATVARWARAIATLQALEIDRLLEIEARLHGS
ncbi:MAG TPA: DUF305 domain-containing protein [Agromyces sp.]